MPGQLDPAIRRGSGEPVLLLHPFSLTHHVWRGVVDQLSDSYEVLAPTMPGHCGGPPLRAREVSAAAIADGVERIIDDAGWQTCHIVGNSLGGWVGLELARRGRARTVTAIAPAGGWRRWSYAEFRVGAIFLAMYPVLLIGRLVGRRGWIRPVVNRMLRIVSHDITALSEHDVETIFHATTRCPCYLPMIVAALRHGPITGLDEVSCPVRLVLADRDRLIPPRRYSSLFVDGLAGVDAVTLSGVGHVPMLEAPDVVAETIREHLVRHSASPAA